MLHINSKILRSVYSLKVNIVIKILTASYVFVLAGWGLVSPLIAVFITENVKGAGIETVGLAMSLYALTRSFLQIPVARFLDIRKGEKDEFVVLFTGMVIVGFTALGYTYVNSTATLFVIQILYGLGDALIYPAWGSLFMSHVDRHERATESSLYQTSADIATALSASLGAFLVVEFGYRPVFFIVAIATWMGALLLPLMYASLKKS